jgi:hypothetical protein
LLVAPGRASFVRYESTRGHLSQCPPTFTIGVPSRDWRACVRVTGATVRSTHSTSMQDIRKKAAPQYLSFTYLRPSHHRRALRRHRRRDRRSSSRRCVLHSGQHRASAVKPEHQSLWKQESCLPTSPMREAQLQRTTETMHGACVVAARCDACQRQTEDCVSRTAACPTCSVVPRPGRSFADVALMHPRIARCRDKVAVDKHCSLHTPADANTSPTPSALLSIDATDSAVPGSLNHGHEAVNSELS